MSDKSSKPQPKPEQKGSRKLPKGAIVGLAVLLILLATGALGIWLYQHRLIEDSIISTVLPRKLLNNLGSPFKSDLIRSEDMITYENEGAIWVSDERGQNQRELIWSPSKFECLCMEWSPDGKNLAFVAIFEAVYPENETYSYDRSKSGLYIYDGSKNRVIFVSKDMFPVGGGGSCAEYGDWSLDGRYYAYLENARSGDGPLKIYDTETQLSSVVKDLPDGEKESTPIYWDNQGMLYLKTFIPLQSCSQPTAYCPIYEESILKSTNSIVQVDPNVNRTKKIVTERRAEGGIVNFILDSKNNVLLYYGEDGHGINQQFYKLNIDTLKKENITKPGIIFPNSSGGDINVSPDGNSFTFVNYNMFPNSFLASFSDLSSKILINHEVNPELGYVTGWYDNDTVLTVVIPNRDVWLLNVHNFKKEKLVVKSKSGVVKVRPRF